MTKAGSNDGRKRAPAPRVVGAGRATPAERRRDPLPPLRRQPTGRSQARERAQHPARGPLKAPAGRSTARVPGRRRPKSPRTRRQRVGIGLWTSAAVAAVAAVGVLFLFPTRTFFDQRHQLGVESQHLRLLNSQNAAMRARIAKDQTDAEIEFLARRDYHLVHPGERAVAILPAPSPTTSAPPPASPQPTGPTHPPLKHAGLWQQLTSWL